MLSVKNAESLILSLVTPILDAETVPLDQSLGRILATDITSEQDFPFWHNAAMDGYAVKFVDCQNLPSLVVTNTSIAAGDHNPHQIKTGECVAIFTGAPMPEGADTVIMQEDGEIMGDRLYLKLQPSYGQYVRQRGEFYRANQTLLKAGTKIDPPQMGILAAFAKKQLQVRRQPRVGTISTGNELKTITDYLGHGQIVDSNQYVLSALISNCGAIPLNFGVVGDQIKQLSILVKEAIATCDLVISTGGASVGKHDYLKNALEELGTDMQITSCAIKPGKPLKVATFDQKIYVGLPGNPASTMVCFYRFIKGAIYKLSGANSEYWFPKFIEASTTEDLHSEGRRETYLWGRLSQNSTQWQFQPVANYSSGNLISWAESNGLAVLRTHQTYVPASEKVQVLII